MTEEELQSSHRFYAADCFNRVWGLLDRSDRTEEEDRLMREMAHASLFHWLCREDAKPMNLSVGLWQLSRVYAVLGRAVESRSYAEECIEISKSAELPPFYQGYGYEAAARAALVSGEEARRETFLKLAREQLEEVVDPEEKALLAADLADLES